MNKDKRIIIVGAGMAGILAGIRLKDQGRDNFAIYEKADKVAGTWRENRYPGLTCDVPSHSYTYSFEPNPEWTQQFPPGPEIFDYFSGVAEKYGLSAHIRFNKEVVSCVFEGGRWTLKTSDGETEQADAVIMATGLLHHPKYPDIDGLDRFEGAMFHSARWPDHLPLEGKRIGVIGSGSTGVQIVAALADTAGKLVHFQRTPQWVMPAVNKRFTEEERAAFRADRDLIRQLHMTPEMAERMRFFTRAVTHADSPEMAVVEKVARDNLENSVRDPALREKLRPNYRAACKRLIISPDYYEKVQQPNVEVVTDPIREVEAKGIRTVDGTLHELDVLVLATGFQADNFMRPMNVVGRGGAELNALWDRRPSAYLAISIPDFPNLFLLNGPSAPFGNFSNIDVVEKQMDFVIQLLDMLKQGNAQEVSVTPRAMRAYDAELKEALKDTIWSTGCKSWYLDADGVPTIWPWSFDEFAERTSKVKKEDFDFVA